MRCVVDQDLKAYADRVTPWLLCDPVGNNVAYTLIHQRLSGAVPTEPDALWLRVLDGHDHLVGVALRTPPFGLLLTRVPDSAVEVLIAEIRRLGIALPSAHGPAGPGQPDQQLDLPEARLLPGHRRAAVALRRAGH